jgi:hypothetical protein
MSRYEALVMVDRQPTQTAVLDNEGRGYATAVGAYRAAVRRGLVPVDVRPLGERLPASDDAQAWDAYRLARGYAGDRH